jgi:hypothetical protein
MQFDRTELSSHARTLYAASRQVANLVWTHLSTRMGATNWAKGWRWKGVNPGAVQTVNGLFLEFYYDWSGPRRADTSGLAGLAVVVVD